jgi:hypothetical protein
LYIEIHAYVPKNFIAEVAAALKQCLALCEDKLKVEECRLLGCGAV